MEIMKFNWYPYFKTKLIETDRKDSPEYAFKIPIREKDKFWKVRLCRFLEFIEKQILLIACNKNSCPILKEITFQGKVKTFSLKRFYYNLINEPLYKLENEQEDALDDFIKIAEKRNQTLTFFRRTPWEIEKRDDGIFVYGRFSADGIK